MDEERARRINELWHRLDPKTALIILLHSWVQAEKNLEERRREKSNRVSRRILTVKH